MREIGIPFQVHAANINEDQIAGEAADRICVAAGAGKSASSSSAYPQSYVLGADTIVVLNGEVLGKPIDHADAARMLRLLSGRAHEVTTAVSLIAPTHSLRQTHITEQSYAENTYIGNNCARHARGDACQHNEGLFS